MNFENKYLNLFLGSKSFSPFNVDEITENLEINNLIKSGFKKKGLDDEENKIIVTEKSSKFWFFCFQ